MCICVCSTKKASVKDNRFQFTQKANDMHFFNLTFFLCIYLSCLDIACGHVLVLFSLRSLIGFMLLAIMCWSGLAHVLLPPPPLCSCLGLVLFVVLLLTGRACACLVVLIWLPVLFSLILIAILLGFGLACFFDLA
jgi:hypothetical protein